MYQKTLQALAFLMVSFWRNSEGLPLGGGNIDSIKDIQSNINSLWREVNALKGALEMHLKGGAFSYSAVDSQKTSDGQRQYFTAPHLETSHHNLHHQQSHNDQNHHDLFHKHDHDHHHDHEHDHHHDHDHHHHYHHDMKHEKEEQATHSDEVEEKNEDKDHQQEHDEDHHEHDHNHSHDHHHEHDHEHENNHQHDHHHEHDHEHENNQQQQQQQQDKLNLEKADHSSPDLIEDHDHHNFHQHTLEDHHHEHDHYNHHDHDHHHHHHHDLEQEKNEQITHRDEVEEKGEEKDLQQTPQQEMEQHTQKVNEHHSTTHSHEHHNHEAHEHDHNHEHDDHHHHHHHDEDGHSHHHHHHDHHDHHNADHHNADHHNAHHFGKDNEHEPLEAFCNLEPNVESPDSRVKGHVVILQAHDGTGPLAFELFLTGFEESDGKTKHGFHIHQSEVVEGRCSSAGPHFNPEGVFHGAPDAEIRHVGDLGNIDVDKKGEVVNVMYDSNAQFYGESSIIGKSIVVHALEDDLGLGGDDGSLATGNAGARLACCNIVAKNVPAKKALFDPTLIRFNGG